MTTMASTDLIPRRRAKDLRAGLSTILEMIARSAPLSEVLDQLMRLNEAQSTGLLGSILLLDADGKTLNHGAAPSLPTDYVRTIDGVQIGPKAGSCGTAAYLKKPVIVTDILADPLWDDYRHIAARFGLRACWSTPIFSSESKVIGTFAMYYRDVRVPAQSELRLVQVTTQLASIAIERMRLEERLRQAQKMEAFGQLTGGIAHDFNNILSVIKGHASLLLIGDLSDSERQSAIAEISAAADRASEMTHHLLTFGRRRLMRLQDYDLNEILATVAGMLKRLIGEHIVFEIGYAQSPVLVRVDPGMIEQVLINLAINARDAMPGGGRLTLETDLVTQPGQGATPSDRDANQYVCLVISDTGTGIASEHLPRIFEPFFTTKEPGKGTGLGLSTVLGIVGQHQGRLEVESQVGKGTVFRLFLPRTANQHLTSKRRPELSEIRGGKETVLLVEDEEAVRRLMQKLLRSRGYEVRAAPSAGAAFRIWKKYRENIDLLITDLVIPGGIDGGSLADRLRSEKPALKVLYSSGYNDELLGKNAALRKSSNYLPKPLDPVTFLQKVRSCLDTEE
ncbi:MAG: response regulator [Verrucomicrobia bacterium]|nr:response regulator [Verrucomicrobiota bacterium]